MYPVKAIFTLPDVTADVAYELMHNAHLRTEWDKFYVEYGVLGRADDINEYLYQAMKGPPGISGRDFCLYRGVKCDYERKVFLLVFKNSYNPLRPVTDKFVRAQCVRSGYVIRPAPDDPKSCQMFVISQNDVKGALPKWLINIVAPRGVEQWYNNFRKACTNLREKLEALAKQRNSGVPLDATEVIEKAQEDIKLDDDFAALDLSAGDAAEVAEDAADEAAAEN